MNMEIIDMEGISVCGILVTCQLLAIKIVTAKLLICAVGLLEATWLMTLCIKCFIVVTTYVNDKLAVYFPSPMAQSFNNFILLGFCVHSYARLFILKYLL